MKIVCTSIPCETKMFTVGKLYTGTKNENGFNACTLLDNIGCERFVSESSISGDHLGFLIFPMGDHGVAKFVPEEVFKTSKKIYKDMVKYNDKSYNDLIEDLADAKTGFEIVKKCRGSYDPVIIAYIVACEKRLKDLS